MSGENSQLSKQNFFSSYDNEDFYLNLLDEDMGSFEEDRYLERLHHHHQAVPLSRGSRESDRQAEARVLQEHREYLSRLQLCRQSLHQPDCRYWRRRADAWGMNLLNIKSKTWHQQLLDVTWATRAGQVWQFRGCFTKLQISWRRVEMVVDSATIEECWSSLCDIRRVTRVSVRITTMGRSVATAREFSEAGGAGKMEVCVTSLLLPVRMVGSGNSSHYHCYCPWDTPANSAIQVHLARIGSPLPRSFLLAVSLVSSVPGRKSPGAGQEDLSSELQGREAGADLQHSKGDRTVGVERSEGYWWWGLHDDLPERRPASRWGPGQETDDGVSGSEGWCRARSKNVRRELSVY